MLLSMTGFGEAQRESEACLVSVEVRTVNNRYLKTTVRLTDGYAALESRVESFLRDWIRRGTVQVTIRIQGRRNIDAFGINVPVLDSYWRQLESLSDKWNMPQTFDLASLLTLPGVVDDAAHSIQVADTEAVWPLVADALRDALENLQRMRRDEGAAMAADIHANLDGIAGLLGRVQKRAPLIAEEYRRRMVERVQKALAEHDVTVDAADVVREVAIFADRCDISEEIVRLQSHLEQFRTIVDSEDIAGRKLDFFTQEMVREVNTIGSKANDVEIAQQVVEAKAAVERIREMIQNVE